MSHINLIVYTAACFTDSLGEWRYFIKAVTLLTASVPNTWLVVTLPSAEDAAETSMK